MTKRTLLRLICLNVSLIFFAGCTGKRKPAETEFFAMDTYITMQAYGDDAVEALKNCVEETRRMESLFSVMSENGDTYRMNHAEGEPVQLSPETAEMLACALAVADKTNGAFDPTVYPLVACWGFFDEVQRVPQQAEIDAVLPMVGYEKVTLLNDTVMLSRGTGIDLGGVAKGYAADRLAMLLREHGMKSALLSLGGNVYVLGTKPNGEAWRIAIQDPKDANAVVGVVAATDMAVVTSGDYQRYFVEDGVTYHHILDPNTGYPVNNGLASVTILCKSAARADALSTALFVMGYDRAVDFWRTEGGFDAVFVFADGTIACTPGLDFASLGEQILNNVE